MIVTWRFLSILSLVSYTESECSSTSYYRDCWIRRFPGLHVDPEESQRRGAQLLQLYRGDSAQNCSRACCLTSNSSCNVAVFHYYTTQDSVNCFHLHCPTVESCILHQRANVIVYNVTKGMDPDLLIFGKPFPSNAQVHPYLASLNISDSSGTDRRQFNRPHMEPSSSAHPTILASTPITSTSTPASSFPISASPPLSVYSTQDKQDTFPASATQPSTALKQSSHLISSPSETNSGLHTSPTIPTILEDSQPYPNDTKGYISRNVTTGNSPQPVSDGEMSQVWHLAANSVLVALATCAALAFGCCCSVLMVASWRGRRRRKGRYQTKLKGKKCSMRLIKYVFVRESS
ncbi:MANSC domain-containing protein 4-like [Tachysurus vachellii]|uniref:MANSC domain-containing protein 4-like n=1 Tax=Tachysurus vachellii TaxID=175792 RepID=UPI00296B519B|nr:MANSC domain-containing protein 4-like [Tachysurus vachellii]